MFILLWYWIYYAPYVPLRLIDQSSESDGNQMLKMKDVVHVSSTGSYMDIQVLGGFAVCPFGVCCLDGVEISIYMLIVETLQRWFAKRNNLRGKKKGNPKLFPCYNHSLL